MCMVLHSLPVKVAYLRQWSFCSEKGELISNRSLISWNWALCKRLRVAWKANSITELKHDGPLSSKEDTVFPKNDCQQPFFESMVCVDSNLLYASQNSAGDQRKIVQLILQSDGVRLECIEEYSTVSCVEDWGKVNSICINDMRIFLSKRHGIIRIDLTTRPFPHSWCFKQSLHFN